MDLCPGRASEQRLRLQQHEHHQPPGPGAAAVSCQERSHHVSLTLGGEQLTRLLLSHDSFLRADEKGKGGKENVERTSGVGSGNCDVQCFSFLSSDPSYVTELTKLIRTTSSAISGEAEDSAKFVSFFPDFVWTVRDFMLELELDGYPITEDEYLENALKLIPGIRARPGWWKVQ